MKLGRPCLAGRYRKCSRQRSGRDDLTGSKGRIDLIACEHIDKITQCRHGATQYIRSATTVDDCVAAFQIDFNGRKRLAPMLGLQPAVCRLLCAKHWVRFVGLKIPWEY